MNDNSPKAAAPDPEIPDELRASLSRSKRPAGYKPTSAEDDGTPEEEKPQQVKLRDVRPFFKKLAVVMKKKHKGLALGADGLPFTTTAITADQTREIRSKNYAGSPPMSPITGDLTPVFVEWLYLTHPFDAAVRYFGRSTHVNINPH